MARIRTIKPEFWADEKLGPLRPLSRLIFLGLISQADDAGRLIDSPKMLNGLLFPYTDDDCTEAIEELAELGVIQRGRTTAGQPIIQVVGWNRHQRIEKPNLKATLGEVSQDSGKRRRKIPDKVRQAIIDQAGGKCELCGVEVKLSKDDRYDRDPKLAEIDHIVALADGGTDEPENLRLLCFSCNRSKAGHDTSARNRRVVGEASGKNHRPDLRSTIYDQRSTISDRAEPVEKTPVAPQPPPPASSWTGRLAQVWTDHIGTVNPGRLGKALKPIVDRHGEAIVARAIALYGADALDRGEIRFCSPENFARTAAQWAKDATPIGERTFEPGAAP